MFRLGFERRGPLLREGAGLADRAAAAARAALADLAETVRRAVAERTPVGATGRLRGSIAAEVRGRGLEDLRGAVATDVPYAPFVESGARGRPARRMFAGGLEASRGRIAERLARLGREIAEALGG